MPSCPSCKHAVSNDALRCPSCGNALERSDDTSAETVVGPEPSRGQNRFVPGALIADRYRVIDLLGRGGMGEVYRAEDLRLGQTVALKFLPSQMANDPDRLEGLIKEVRIARRIAHPNVCRVYDIGDADGNTFITMEYVDGEDLATLLRRIGRFPEDKAIQIARQLCSGIAAAHREGVLHRDLKPANVMLDGRGNVRVTDFGLALLETEANRSNPRSGTPKYMAPEQVAGQPPTFRTDIYALGLVLHEIFTGKPAFDSSKGPRSDTTSSLSSSLSNSDPAVERVILGCLQREPASRPASALAVAAGLPGADTLAAALAAGETPSPELVAASPTAGNVSPSWSLGGFVLCLALLAAFFAVSVGELETVAPRAPEVMVDRARTIARTLGFDPKRHESWGYEVNEDIVKILYTQHPADATRLFEANRPYMALFWYRTSPDDLTPVKSSVATATDPPLTPGSLVLRLDQEGRLYSLDSVPGGAEEISPIAAEPEPWRRTLEVSGFSTSSLKPVPSDEEPLYFADTRAAWLLPAGSSDSLRIEAGMRAGRLSFFRVKPDCLLSGKAHVESFNRNVEVFVVLLLVLYLGILVAGIILARKNLKNGRGDRKGAFRLGVLTVALIFVTWLLEGSHSLTITELRNATNTLGLSLFFGLGVYILYIALEPEIRRRWPQKIVSWARLLEGRFTDPMVGRDILIGTILGLTVQLLRSSTMYALRTSGVSLMPDMDFVLDNAARGTPGVLNGITTAVFSGLTIGLAFYLLVLLFTIVFRKEWLGLLAFGGICVFGLFFITPGWYWLAQILSFTLWVAVFSRLGLLAWIVNSIVFQLLLGDPSYPRVADMSSWYRSDYLTYLSFIVFLAAWGAWWAARRPAGMRNLRTRS